MPASLIGVSNTRSRAELGLQAVGDAEHAAERPTSSPNTRTRGSSARASRSARFRAAESVQVRVATSIRLPPDASALPRDPPPGGSAYVQSNIHSAGGGSVATTPARTSSANASASASHAATNPSSAWAAAEPVVYRAIGSAARAAFDLGVVPVPGRVVRRGVGADAIRQRLDQRRAVAPPRARDRVARDREDREHVVAVHADAGDAVALRALPDLAGGLRRGGDADRPPVVLAEENRRGRSTRPARFTASWKSPSLVLPSPKYASVTASVPSSFCPSAWPTACEIWVAMGMQIGPNRVARGSYGPPCQVPRWYCRYWTASTPRTSATASSRNVGKTKSSGPRANALPTWAASWPSKPGVDGQLALALQRDAFAVETARDDHMPEHGAQVVPRQTDVGVADRRAVGIDDPKRVGPGPILGCVHASTPLSRTPRA